MYHIAPYKVLPFFPPHINFTYTPFRFLCSENLSAVYDEREKLAKYFLSENDLWLADHFFQSCLETAKSVVDRGDRKEAEAHCHIGLGFERRSEYSADTV